MIFMFVAGLKLINTTRNCEANSFKDLMRECSGRVITIERRKKVFTSLKVVWGGLGAKLINTIIKWRKILLHGCYIIKRTFDLIKRVGNNLSNSRIRSIEFKHVQGKVA